jgi:hypothetical protein
MRQLGPEIFDLLNARQSVGSQQPVVYGKGGMSSSDIENVEKQLGFKMPEDFKYLLQNVKDPGGTLFPWSKFTKKEYDDLIDWVFHGVAFDIEHNACWLQNRWGPRPKTLAECIDIARKDFVTWPKLLPVYGHRFLAAEPCLPDNPVFSIMQTDIIYYGANLAHYLLQEFIQDHKNYAANTYEQGIRQIEVWSDFASQ